MLSPRLLLACAIAASPLAQAQADVWDRAAAAAERSVRMQRAEHARIAADLEQLVEVEREIDARSDDSFESNYDLAYVLWRQGQLHRRTGNERERKRLFERANERIERALEQRPDDLEARILHSGTLNSLAGEGMFARVHFGPRSLALSVENYERAPENPRALLQRGLMYLFAPAAFGGDLAAAVRSFRAAREIFARTDDAAEWPSWGRTDSAAWLGQALVKSGRIDEARAVYRDALALHPDASWIRDRLLPAIDPSVAARNQD